MTQKIRLATLALVAAALNVLGGAAQLKKPLESPKADPRSKSDMSASIPSTQEGPLKIDLDQIESANGTGSKTMTSF